LSGFLAKTLQNQLFSEGKISLDHCTITKWKFSSTINGSIFRRSQNGKYELCSKMFTWSFKCRTEWPKCLKLCRTTLGAPVHLSLTRLSKIGPLYVTCLSIIIHLSITLMRKHSFVSLRWFYTRWGQVQEIPRFDKDIALAKK
jgi:hypothetical protein